MRLDHYLVSQKITSSRSQISRWIHQGNVLVNGRPSKPSYHLKEKDRVDINPPKVKSNILTPEAIPLKVLYEDDDLLVINKPSNLVVHPGAGHQQGTLVHALLAHCRGLSQIGGVERPGIVHRLDKGTSGAMVIAKNDATHIELSRQFTNHLVKKIYWVVVDGKMKNKKGTIQTLIARSPSHRKKFAVTKRGGKKAVTHYQVLKEGEGISLLEVSLETGRTHQIRVHLTNEGHGVVGDPLYGGHAKKCKNIQSDHPLLHSRIIGFTHPAKMKWMEYTAELPDDFKRIYDSFF